MIAKVVAAAVRAAVAAADPAVSVSNAIEWTSRRSLRIVNRNLDTVSVNDILVLAAGKASVPMTYAAVHALRSKSPLHNPTSTVESTPTPIDIQIRALAVTKTGHAAGAVPHADISIVEAAHPTPDAAGMAAAERVLSLAASAGPATLVLVLLSGGGSSLLPLPTAGLTLADLQCTGDALLASGATIDEINCVRKHCSRISGGRLAAAASNAAAIVTLALSDVIGDRPDVIASGPTVGDPTTFQDALDVLQRRRIADKVPVAVVDHLRAGAGGMRSETPKTVPLQSSYHLVGGNAAAVAAVASSLSSAGYRSAVMTTSLQGEASEAGKALASLLHGSVTGVSTAFKPPCALVFGGETTVTLGPGCTGKGGRNQELALAGGMTMASLLPPTCSVPWSITAVGTDGTDGPTDAAGAMWTQDTASIAAQAGCNPAATLAAHDSYHFFSAVDTQQRSTDEGGPRVVAAGDADQCTMGESPLHLSPAGGLIVTGPTGTNVMDITILLAGEPVAEVADG